MAADDEIIRAYDDELGPEPTPPSNRRFWLVVGVMALGGIILVVEIFANRGIADTIGHAQHTLRRAQEAAEIVQIRTGSFEEASAEELEQDVADLAFRDAADESFGLDVVSVSASDTTWAAAVQARPGACFYLRLDVGADPRYGSGTECTGEAALSAADPRW
ncbi:MAG TPA: hypothetical protein VFZ75_03460 [Actinomycetota bacterium]|nr:hypothetical protein [Actinomycetota bacterium]